MQIALVPTEDVEVALPTVEPFIQRSIDEYPFVQSIELFRMKLLDGSFQLWVGVDEKSLEVLGAMVTFFYRMPVDNYIFEILSIGGDIGLEVCQSKMEIVENYAKARGATVILLRGRVGWKKVLKDNGYSYKQDVLLYKNLRTLH